MLLQNFTEQVLLQAGDLRNAPLFFYQDFADFFKQLATPSIGNLQNGVVGPTSFATTLDAGTLTINPGVLFARFTDPANAPDFPDYCFGSNLSDGEVTLPASDGTLVANFNYDSVEGTRYIFAPAATGIPATPVSIPVVRFLTVSFSIITVAPTIYQCPLYEISGTSITDVRNILLTPGAGTGDGQTIQVVGSTISAITPAGAGNGLVSQGAIDQTIGGTKTFSSNLKLFGTPSVNQDAVNKGYVDSRTVEYVSGVSFASSDITSKTGYLAGASISDYSHRWNIYKKGSVSYGVSGSFSFSFSSASTLNETFGRFDLPRIISSSYGSVVMSGFVYAPGVSSGQYRPIFTFAGNLDGSSPLMDLTTACQVPGVSAGSIFGTYFLTVP